MKYAKQFFPIYSVPLTLVSGLACAADVNVSTGLGYDSNPYRLNESLTITEDYFWHNSASIKIEPVNNWDIYAKVDGKNYLEDGNADSLKTRIKTSVEAELSKQFELQLALAYDAFDKVYVSRTSGKPYFVDERDATDRYDSQRWTSDIQLAFKASKRNKLVFGYEYQKQAYEDLTSLGLSNLDYQQHALSSEWQYRVTKALRVSPSVEYRLRIYDDKRAKDLAGKDIEHSSLEYEYWGAGVKFIYRINKANRLYARFTRWERSDNASGYYDTSYNQGLLSWKHKFNKTDSFSISSIYSDLQYERNTNGSQENEDELPSNKGWRLSADYEQLLFEIGATPVKWYSDVSYASFDADLVSYQYDRLMVETGLKIRI